GHGLDHPGARRPAGRGHRSDRSRDGGGRPRGCVRRAHARGAAQRPRDRESGAVNLVGFYTLFYKEVLRFFKVLLQTVFAPVLTALLYLLVFGQVLEGRLEVFPGVSYTAFLIPGLMMMSTLQNAFANSSSSLIQSKVT